MTSNAKLRKNATLIKLVSVLTSILLFSGCAVPLSKNTCSSLQGVSMRIMNDRQAGLTKEEAVTKLTHFTSGKSDSKHFFEVASQLIESAYKEPLGTSETEKSEITKSFVSRMHDKCTSGELSPSYNPVIRAAPAVY